MEIDKKKLMADRMVMLQAFVEYYLKFTKGKTFQELYPDIKDEYGKLNKKQEELLHEYLDTVYKGFGLDLNKILEEKKAEVKPGNVLTDYEMKELLRLADEELLLGGTILERKARLYIKDNK